ncbi:MAG TPA: formyltransferase family protein [Candidatus Eremiobacteraceae bacterium]
MIYHFCNAAFGETFRVLAADFGQRHGLPITTVMSRPPGRQGRLADPVVVADVNAPDFLAGIAPADRAIVTGFSQIFSQAAIDRFASIVNIHASLLPFYRGPTPTYWCIANHERTTGYTLHGITKKIDSGPILYQGIVPVDGIRNPMTLSSRISAAAGDTFVRYLDHLRTGSPWEIRIVDAVAAYTTHVNYRSFPPEH